MARRGQARRWSEFQKTKRNTRVLNNLRTVEVRSTDWPIWRRAGRRLIAALGWNIEETVKTRVFENVCVPPTEKKNHVGGLLGNSCKQAHEPERNTFESWRERRLPAANNQNDEKQNLRLKVGSGAYLPLLS